MVEHVARTLCWTAVTEIQGERKRCCHCGSVERSPRCSLWPEFVNEAQAAIEAVRDYARLDMRRRPRAA